MAIGNQGMGFAWFCKNALDTDIKPRRSWKLPKELPASGEGLSCYLLINLFI